jgi:predicted nuclease of predicted toxin-antitoxin system
MILWIDAHFSPVSAAWIAERFPVEAIALRDLGLRDAEDDDIFAAARAAGAIVMTKDSDFLTLLDRHGPPPQILWITCGNTSNARLQEILSVALAEALNLLSSGEHLVEISDA